MTDIDPETEINFWHFWLRPVVGIAIFLVSTPIYFVLICSIISALHPHSNFDPPIVSSQFGWWALEILVGAGLLATITATALIALDSKLRSGSWFWQSENEPMDVIGSRDSRG